MGTDVYVRHVARVIPRRLSFHVVRYQSAVDAEVLETDVGYLALVIVALDDRDARRIARIADVLEQHVLDAPAGG